MADPRGDDDQLQEGGELQETGQAVVSAARAIEGEELAAQVAQDVGATGGAMSYIHSDVSRTAITRGSAPPRGQTPHPLNLPDDFGWQFNSVRYSYPPHFPPYQPPPSPNFPGQPPYPMYFGSGYYPPPGRKCEHSFKLADSP